VSESHPAALPPDAVFHGRYRVVRALAAGGMGAVYEVVDEVTTARRALKTMLPEVVADPDLRARFAQEARITGDIESDHIVRVSDAGVDEATATPFLVMDLLRGEDLRQIIGERGALPAAEVVRHLGQVGMALDKTHAAGIVHRDLKPDNLFVTRRDDGTTCVKVLDFGIAKVIAAGQSQDPTRPVGTPLYMAPEQIRGEGGLGPAADLYALGHIAYDMLTGEPYWSEERAGKLPLLQLYGTLAAGPKEPASTRARRRAVTSSGTPLLAGDLPRAFDGWFARATAAKAGDRFERASEMVAALADALGVAAPTPAKGVAERAEQAAKSKAIAAAATLVTTPVPGHTPTRSWTGKAAVGERLPEPPGARNRLGWVAVIVAVLLLGGLTLALLLGRSP
jgi:serine/threonine-protein kinase